MLLGALVPNPDLFFSSQSVTVYVNQVVEANSKKVGGKTRVPPIIPHLSVWGASQIKTYWIWLKPPKLSKCQAGVSQAQAQTP